MFKLQKSHYKKRDKDRVESRERDTLPNTTTKYWYRKSVITGMRAASKCVSASVCSSNSGGYTVSCNFSPLSPLISSGNGANAKRKTFHHTQYEESWLIYYSLMQEDRTDTSKRGSSRSSVIVVGQDKSLPPLPLTTTNIYMQGWRPPSHSIPKSLHSYRPTKLSIPLISWHFSLFL